MNALFAMFKCWRYGHQYSYVEMLNPHCVRLGCDCCGKNIAYNAGSQMSVPWEKVETWYGDDGYLHPACANHPIFHPADAPRSPLREKITVDDPETDRFCNHRME
jgi:hypothetical protein